jgi:formate dehydrogenase maturation protein FdhE
LESIIHFVHFYRRQNNLNAALDLLTKQKEQIDAKFLPFLYMQTAHFIRTIKTDADGARAVYKEAVQKCPADKSIWIAYALFELNLGGTS